jgi:hypothetical protein
MMLTAEARKERDQRDRDSVERYAVNELRQNLNSARRWFDVQKAFQIFEEDYRLSGVNRGAAEEALIASGDFNRNPVKMFIRNCCIQDIGGRVYTDHVFDAWKKFCEGHEGILGSKSILGAAIKMALPSVGRAKTGKKRGQLYRGSYYTGMTMEGYKFDKYRADYVRNADANALDAYNEMRRQGFVQHPTQRRPYPASQVIRRSRRSDPEPAAGAADTKIDDVRKTKLQIAPGGPIDTLLRARDAFLEALTKAREANPDMTIEVVWLNFGSEPKIKASMDFIL